MWLGIAISGLFGGLDINDTNTSINLFNQAPSFPPILASASALPASKMGLWMWVTGTPQGPAVTPNPVTCGADFICIMTQSVVALTPNNLFVGAIFMAFIYSIFTTFGLIFGVAYLSKSFGFNNISMPNGVLLMVWFGWFMLWPSLVGALWFTILIFIMMILVFASFSGTLLKGSTLGGQTA